MNEKPWGIVVKRLRQPSKYEVSFSVHVIKTPGEREFFTHSEFSKKLVEVKKKFLGNNRFLGNMELTVDPEEKTFLLTDLFPISGDKKIHKKLEGQGAGLFAQKEMVKSLIETHPSWSIKPVFFSHDSNTARYLQGMRITLRKTYPLKEYLEILEAHEERLRRKRS